MNYRTLGRTGLTVSEIGLGSEAFVNQSVEYGVELIDAALGAGVNYFDLYNPEPYVRDAFGKAILSDNLLSMPIPVKRIAADYIPLPSFKEPIYFQTNNHLCYSFRICKLERHITPYKHIADIIIHLPYKIYKSSSFP